MWNFVTLKPKIEIQFPPKIYVLRSSEIKRFFGH